MNGALHRESSGHLQHVKMAIVDKHKGWTQWMMQSFYWQKISGICWQNAPINLAKFYFEIKIPESTALKVKFLTPMDALNAKSVTKEVKINAKFFICPKTTQKAGIGRCEMKTKTAYRELEHIILEEPYRKIANHFTYRP